jgi:Fe-S oxidoreductase
MNPIITAFLLLAGLSAFVYTMYGRVFALTGMKWTNRFDRPLERLKGLVLFGLGQKRMVDPEERGPGVMHVLIFAAFMVLAARTIMLFAMGFSHDLLVVLSTPTARFWERNPGIRTVFEAYLFVKDLVALGALVGALYFIYLRKAVKPDRMTQSGEAMLILGFIIGLMVSEYLFSASEMVIQHRGFTFTEPVTSGVALALSPLSYWPLWTIGGLAFWTHLTIILAFLNFLPIGKHFHVITGLPNVFFRRISPSGKLHTADLEKEDFGAKTVRDLHWKNGLDLYSCTECGRCQTHCPTYITGKPLTHKGVNQDLKHFVWDHQLEVGGYQQHGDETAPELPSIIGNILKPETVWACTSCGWCETACPVFIENIPRLIDMRRYKVQVEADFPHELQRVFEGIERQGNPWGIAQDKRDEWAEDLAIPQWGDGGTYEYLFFVGCAGSYDDRQKKVSRAMVKILREAGISFATMAKGEMCTGDPARRGGNEFLYQTMAKANVETWNSLGVKAVITQCPHCFNTIKNEYPDFGGNYRVISHAQLLSELIREKRVKLSRVMDETLTYHDPCYLGRHNGVFEEPRAALKAIPGLNVIDMQRSKRESFCCGAGGSRMWMEERIGSRINQNRMNEVALTLAHAKDPSVPFPSATDKQRPGQVGEYKGQAEGTVAVACPFCMTMLRDAANETGREKIKVRDLAEIVADAIEAKPASAAKS